MNDNPEPIQPSPISIPKPLVTVERQVETDLATGRTERRMFVKMYFDARDSGLLAALPGELWKMLCCLATYMDEHGNCSPSQARIAHDLGISRQRVNERVQALQRFRFRGEPILRIEKLARSDSPGGRWQRNRYAISPIASVGIFHDRGASKDPNSAAPPAPARVRKSGHGGRPPVSVPADTADPDTNQIHDLNQNTRVSSSRGTRRATPEAPALVALFHRLRGHADTRPPAAKELEQAGALVAALGLPASEYVVRFAMRAAEETRFEMLHFGAVLQYLDAALIDRRAREEAAVAEGERRLREKYDRWRAEQIEAQRRAIPAADLAALEERLRSERAPSHPRVAKLAGWLRAAVDEAIAAELRLPGFDAWVAARAAGADTAGPPAELAAHPAWRLPRT